MKLGCTTSRLTASINRAKSALREYPNVNLMKAVLRVQQNQTAWSIQTAADQFRKAAN